jgi:hypothetical protein
LAIAANFVYCARNLVPIAGALQRLVPSGYHAHSMMAAARVLVEAFTDLRDSPNLLYVAAYFFAALLCYTLFTVAFYHELTRILAGERPSLARGLCFACMRIVPILGWILLAFPVWMLVEVGTQRFGTALKVAMGLGGLLWGCAAIFAIPVLLRGGALAPFAVLRRSWFAVRRTWTELLCLYAAFVAAEVLTRILIKVLPGLVHSPDLAPALAAVARVAFRVATNTMANLYLCALYICATEGVAPNPIPPKEMDETWEVRAQ